MGRRLPRDRHGRRRRPTGTHRYPGPPYRFAGRTLTVRRPPVRLGEHNEHVWLDLIGVSEETYRRLVAEGRVGTEYAPEIR